MSPSQLLLAEAAEVAEVTEVFLGSGEGVLRGDEPDVLLANDFWKSSKAIKAWKKDSFGESLV